MKVGFGENIRRIRKSKKITGRQLAFMIGMSENGIVNYEREVRQPTIATLYKIADTLEVSILDILGEKPTVISEVVAVEKPLKDYTTDELLRELHRRITE